MLEPIPDALLARDEPAIVLFVMPGCEVHCHVPWHDFYPLYRPLRIGSYTRHEWRTHCFEAMT